MSSGEPGLDAALARIAEALERLVPDAAGAPDWRAHPAYVWEAGKAEAVPTLTALPLALLKGIDAQKQVFADNLARHARGLPAHDALLWGARGMGKSALVAAATRAVQDDGHDLALVQLAGGPASLASLPALFAALAPVDRRFLLFIDDIGFEGREGQEAARQLRSLLEGGTRARPGNVRLAVTSNRRAIVERHADEQDDPINPRDALDDRLALADRFGLSLGFHACDQDQYLTILRGYAAAHGLDLDEEDALLWARQRGARSGRTAWHYIVEIAGRAGLRLDR